MRLGVVTTSYPREPGEPAGSFVSALNDWLLRCGHHPEVLASGGGQQDDSWQPLPVHRITTAKGLFYQGGAPDALSRAGAKWAAGLFSIQMLWAIRRRFGACDGLIAHWLVPSAIAAVLAAPAKPIWAIAHGGDVHLLKKLGLSAAMARLLDRPNLHLNFVSHELRDTFARSAGRAGDKLMARAGVCPMGIDLPHFQTLAARREQTPRIAPPHILFLGRLVGIKGVDLLLDALATIDRPFTLSIAGDGPEEAALRAQAIGLGIAVEWCGQVRGTARDAQLAAADLVVVPSRIAGGRQEGMPQVALEALAAGAQLVVAQSGGLAEIPESICFQVPVADVPSLRAVISELLAGRRAPYAPGHWLENHDWDSIGPRLLPGLRPVERHSI